jgi:hypothetical protein
MKRAATLGMFALIAFGGASALSLHAGEVKDPASVSESAPDKTGKKAKGAAGTPTTPSKGPASVSESAPQKTGKEPPAPAAKADSKNMPNPKTPSSVSESDPAKSADKDKKSSAK